MYDVYSCGFDGVIVRPKRVHKQNILFLRRILLVKEAPATPGELTVEWPRTVGGGRGRVNPPPRSLVWRFWRFGGLLGDGIYTPIEARGLGGL